MRTRTKVVAGAAGAVGTFGAGAAAGMATVARDTEKMKADVERDVQSLRSAGTLPTASPSLKLTPHRNHSMVACFALGILASGFVVWLIAVIIATSATSGLADPSRGPGGSPVLVGLFAGFVAGIFGFVVPGIPAGGLLWLWETKTRVHETIGVPYREYWQHRQVIPQQIANRQVTPEDAASALWQRCLAVIPPEQMPINGYWLGSAGDVVTTSAKVEVVGLVSGEGTSVNTYTSYDLRTGDGNAITWMAARDRGLREGDVVTIQGTVKATSTCSGPEGREALTELWYVQVLDKIRPEQPVVQQQAPPPSVEPEPTGQWHGTEGEVLDIGAEVQSVEPWTSEHGTTFVVHDMRSGEGDAIRWMADQKYLDVGVVAILSGTVTSHGVTDGERVTDLWQVTVHNVIGGAKDARRI